MNEVVSIEVFREDHIPGALALWGATEYIGLSSADEPEALVRYLCRNLGFSFVALDQAGRIAGAVLCGHDGRRGFIHHLAVTPTQRKAGVGSRLLDRSLDMLRQAKIFKCHAFVFQDNPFGDLFWQPAGWQRRDELLVYSKSIVEIELLL